MLSLLQSHIVPLIKTKKRQSFKWELLETYENKDFVHFNGIKSKVVIRLVSPYLKKMGSLFKFPYRPYCMVGTKNFKIDR